MAIGKKIAWFLADCGWDVAWEFVPNFISIPYKFGEKFYRHFLAADPKTQCELLQMVKDLPDTEVDILAQHVVAHCQQRASKPLPNNVGQLARELILDLRAASRHSPAAPAAAEAVRRSINQRLKARGEKAIKPFQMAPEQQVIGRLVTASMARRRQQPARTGVQAGMPWIPGYQMLRPLGRGGFATVYLARHEETGELRAIKVGKLDDPRRLDREMSILQSVDHPNLVSYREHGGLRGSYWIAMEYLGECNLADLLANVEVRPSLQLALCLGEQILRGLTALHEKQIIHRDLKPENVMVDAEFRVRLIDFGLARTIRSAEAKTTGVTVAGELIGTPQYMSPEQVRGEPNLTPTTDVWSFGVILYQLLVGKDLFLGVNVAMVWNDILTKPLTFDREQIPPEFRSFLSRCLNREASHRFPDAAQARAEFSQISVDLQRRLRYERHREKWILILKNGLLEQFAATHHGQLPLDSIVQFRAFCSKQGFDRSFDQERLQEVLPPIFASQAKVEATHRELVQSRKKFQQELLNLSTAEIDKWNKKNAELEAEIEAGPSTVRAETHRLLAAEVATWEENERQEAERRERRREEEYERLEADTREKTMYAPTAYDHILDIIGSVIGAVTFKAISASVIGAVGGLIIGVFLSIPVAIIVVIASWIFKWNSETVNVVTQVLFNSCGWGGGAIGGVTAFLRTKNSES